jgi:hypothetical protein
MKTFILLVAVVFVAACQSPTAVDSCSARTWYDTTDITFTDATGRQVRLAKQEWAHVPYGCPLVYGKTIFE